MHQIQHEDGTIEFTFDSTAERDQYIDKHFPKRKLQDTPGSYLLPDGSELQVFLEKAWHVPAPQTPEAP